MRNGSGRENDTIAAVASATGGAIGVIRVSGRDVEKIAAVLVKKKLMPRHAHFCQLLDVNDIPIDQGIALLFKGPESYTGEDVLELFAHGSSILLNTLLTRILSLGARHARPGEFSERAFLNGKIDLVQAEAIAALIASNSEVSVRSAMKSLRGQFSESINELKDEIMALRADCEAMLDFPDETETVSDLATFFLRLSQCQIKLRQFLEVATQGARVRNSVKIVIIGRPNVGKSSLMNALCQFDRAIVSAIPGTTRDLLTEQLVLDGVTVELVDTAGIRDTTSEVEAEGVKRAEAEIAQADIILEVLELEDREGHSRLFETANHPCIRVYNKLDLYEDEKPALRQDKENIVHVSLSAKTGAGIPLLLNSIKQVLTPIEESSLLQARDRHIDLLKEILSEWEMDNTPLDLIAEKLRHAQQQLDKMTGVTYTEDLLEEIFSKFCIGK